MPLANSLTPEKRFIALFIGEKHSGKTTAACSWLNPETTGKAKVLDGDGRIRGILGSPWVDKSRIEYDYYPPRVIGQNKTFYERVNQDLEAMMVDLNSGKCPYETYIGDSATSFCTNLMLDAIPLTHQANKGRKIGPISMAGPEDYGFESTGMQSYLSFLRSLPLNIILTAHVVPKYGKPTKDNGETDTYAESIVVGEKLSLRDKISENTKIYFDHIFRFTRRMQGGRERFFVEFRGDLACTSFPFLTTGEHDITGVSFYKFVMDQIKGASQ